MNLNALIKQFMSTTEADLLSDRFVVIRYDGICVYSNAEDDFESASICALVSGLWQAAKSLNTLVEKKNDFYNHRLAFDTANTGLYILPINILGEEYFICSLYNDIQNPAKLKREVRVLKEELERYLDSNKIEKSIDRSGYLFKNITDDEIDKIFEYGG